MNKPILDIYAGKKAHLALQQEGFDQRLFNTLFGASGGPKWFVLFGLDQYLMGTFFKHRHSPLDIIGSSSGAFRTACASLSDPVGAFTRFANAYLDTTYSKKTTPKEVTLTAKALINAIFHNINPEEILNNTIFKPNFITTRVKGLLTSHHKLAQITALLGDYCLNRINRKLLKYRYERCIFQPTSSNLTLQNDDPFKTHYIKLNKNNIKSSLLASGSIPFLLESVNNIAGAPTGHYLDGGLLDYHLDIAIQESAGLTLYPHFSHDVKPGWFDKHLHRTAKPHHYDNVVMLVPSKQFIHSLPNHKIPDRSHYTKFSNPSRTKAWKQVLTESHHLSEAFHDFIEHFDPGKIKPMTDLLKTRP